MALINENGPQSEAGLQILYLEAFFGGSHRAFAEGLQRHSRHQIELITLPDRFWKWRMRGAALQMIPRIPPWRTST